MEEQIEIVVFDDGEGGEFPFAVVDRLEYHGRQYIVLLPEDDTDCDEFLIMQVVTSSRNQEEYLSITKEETLQAVFELFQERHAGEYEFR